MPFMTSDIMGNKHGVICVHHLTILTLVPNTLNSIINIPNDTNSTNGVHAYNRCNNYVAKEKMLTEK